MRTGTKPTCSRRPGPPKLVQCRFGTGGRAGRGWQARSLHAPELRGHGGKSGVGSSIALGRLRRHGATCAGCAASGLDAYPGRFHRSLVFCLPPHSCLFYNNRHTRVFKVPCKLAFRQLTLCARALARAGNCKECLMAIKAHYQFVRPHYEFVSPACCLSSLTLMPPDLLVRPHCQLLVSSQREPRAWLTKRPTITQKRPTITQKRTTMTGGMLTKSASSPLTWITRSSSLLWV